MNEKHVKAKIAGIKSWLGDRRIRVKQTIGISKNQLELTSRILKVREIVDRIPEDKTLLLYADDPHIHYLFRFTSLAKKNIKGIVDDASNRRVCNPYDNYKQYPVFYFEESGWQDADYILIGRLDDSVLKEKLKTGTYSGELISIYEAEDCIPFYLVPKSMAALDQSKLNKVAEKVYANIWETPPEHYYNMIARIDKINHILDGCGDGRILVYCVGGHTKCLFEYTNIKYKNVVAFADRGAREFCGIPVRGVETADFADIDYIVISSFNYQEEIEKYLCGLGLQEKIVKLYDSTDETSFYETPNVCAPDRHALYERSRNSYTPADIYAAAEWSSECLSEDSQFIVTYNLLADQMIDDGFFYNTGEKEVIAEKGYIEENEKTAIILQGPVVYDDDFTYRTVCYYKVFFPGTRVILSTWVGEEKKPEFERFRKLGIEVVLSELPPKAGILNLNYQVLSTYAGLTRAKELSCEYSLKTRTDFRIYADDSLSYLCTLTEAFPANRRSGKRISVLQPHLDMAYYIPDFVQFGTTEDMLELWDASELYPDHTDGINPEMLLFSRYIKRLGSYVENPMEHLKEYIDMLCREFIIVDSSTYKYFWRKYSYEGSIMYQESANRLTAADWFKRQIENRRKK